VHPVLLSKFSDTAKTYNRTKLSLGLLSSALSFLLLVALVAWGWSAALSAWARSVIPGAYGALLVFAAAVAAVQTAITLPFAFVLGYLIEHRYGLSTQSFGRWAWERLKAFLVSAPLAAALVIALYACLEYCGSSWWLALALLVTVANLLFARLAPVLLLRVFYTVVPIGEGPLKERITLLCKSAGIHFQGIYSYNLSKNTRKANAAFTGIGKAKRVLLGDTLLQEFTEAEIETVVAHELGHLRRHHIPIGIAVGALFTFLGLFAAGQLYSWSLVRTGFAGPTDIAALPLLAIWLSLFALVTMPLGNMLSRRHEREADAFAVRITGNAAAFASALRKLSARNLADQAPHPLVEFLFYSHPSIGRRLQALEGADAT
jgi:STE24 endopeptidase